MRRTEEAVLATPRADRSVRTSEELYLAEYRPMVRLAFVMLDGDERAEESPRTASV